MCRAGIGGSRNGECKPDSRMPEKRDQDAAQDIGISGAKAPLIVTSEELFGDEKLVIIRHKQEDYLLRKTAAGKLILTK